MTGAVKQLYEMLTAEEIDEQTLKDTMEAIGADDKINSYCKVIRQFGADLEGIKTEIDRLQAMKKTVENAEKRMKQSVIEFMSAQGKKKIDTGLFGCTIAETKSVNLTNVAAVPDTFKIPQEPKIDKSGIRTALMNGITVPGAELQINESLRIR